MKLSHACCLLSAVVWLPVATAQTNAPFNRAISVTRQFTAYAPNPTLPAALCVFAERLKRDWLARLELTDTWRDPIVIVVRDRPPTNAVAAPVNFGITRIGPVVKYEISCAIPPPLEETTLATALVQAMCLEYANRTRPGNAATNWHSATVPLWLTLGFGASLRGRPEWLVPVARRAANSARPPRATDLLRITTLPGDESSRDLFEANAWLLTEGLLRLPNGVPKFQRLLGELAWSKTPDEAFWRVYAENFGDQLGLETWWVKQQARLATIVIPQNLTAAATTQQLEALLQFENGFHFHTLERAAEQSWLKTALVQRQTDLEKLLSKAHPLYRSAILSYCAAGQLILEEKINRYRRQVRQAAAERADADRQMRAIAAALDQAERAYLAGPPPATWEKLLRPLEQAAEFEKHRRNPISNYLDKFDR